MWRITAAAGGGTIAGIAAGIIIIGSTATERTAARPVALFEAWPNHRRLARQGSAPDQVPNPMAILALTPRRGLQKVDSAMAQVTTDHNTIRKWAEKKGGKPAAVKRTHQGGDVGIIRIMFPDRPQSEHEALEQISWDEFFRQFEQSKLALLYEEDSLFSKIVGRDTAERREHGEKHAAR